MRSYANSVLPSYALGRLATATPLRSISHVCSFSLCFCSLYFTFSWVFSSFTSLPLFLPSSFCPRVHQFHPAPHCGCAPPAAQDLGGVGSQGSNLLTSSPDNPDIDTVRDVHFEADLLVCLPPLPWLFDFLSGPTASHCLAMETQEDDAKTKFQGFLMAKPALVKAIEFQLSTSSLKGNYQNMLESAPPNAI